MDYFEKQLERIRVILGEMQVSPEDVRLLNMDLEKNDCKDFETFLREGKIGGQDYEFGGSGIPNWMKSEKKDEQDFIFKFDLLVLSRYLHRPLFSLMSKMVRKNGFVLFHQFLEGCEKVGKCTPKKPKFILKNGELRSVFSEERGEWKIFHDEIVNLKDGRPLSYFMAMKLKD